MKNLKKNTIILLLITLIVLFFVLKDNFLLVLQNITNVNYIWILLSIVCVVLYWLCQALSMYTIAREYSKDLKFKSIFQQILVTQFFNGITPFSTGGQPMSVYMLNKSNIKITHATNIIVQNFVLYQTALISIGAIAVIINHYLNLFVNAPILKNLILLGFTINTLVGLVLLFISFSTKFNKSFIFKALSILSKLKLIKDKDQKEQKWNKRLQEFHASAELLKQKKSLFIKGYLYNFTGLIAFYLVPLFVMFSLKDYHSLNVINTIVSSAYVLIMGSFVPIPGGSGGVEYGYMQFFGNFTSGAILSTSLLLWRFITYYLGILIGGIMLSFYKGEDQKCV